MPLVTLEKAIKPLIPHVPEIEHMADNALANGALISNSLSIDERASVMLYSMEWSPRQNSFYLVLNDVLRSSKREEQLPPWYLFLKLFFTALTKLRSTGGRLVYRGVKMDLRNEYPEGSKVIWWGFSSCTSRVRVLENEQFFGKTGTRTLFTIESLTGKDIREMAMFPEEEEILLLPGREFQVASCLDAGNNLYVIHLKEIEPRFPHIASVVAAEAKKPVPVELTLNSRGLTDTDIQRVITEALIHKKCTSLILSHNEITDMGVAIIAASIENNEVRF